ncbi:MAG: PP2C family protein-serine/threonine phosphatase [bacterium]
MEVANIVDVLNVLDVSKVSGVLGGMSRLTRSRIVIVSISGRVIQTVGSSPLTPSDEQRVCGVMLRLCRESVDTSRSLREGVGPETIVADVVTMRGLQVGIVAAIGEEIFEGAADTALHNVKTHVESLIRNEYELECLSGEIAERYEEVNLLYELSESLAAVYEVSTICRVAIEKGLSITGATSAVVLLRGAGAGGAGELTVVAAEGVDAERLIGGRVAADNAFVAAVHATSSSLLVTGFADFPDVPVVIGSERAALFFDLPVLAVPLRGDDTAQGFIAVSGTEFGDPFRAGDMKNLASIAMQTSIALQNCRLIEEAKQAERVKRDMELAEAIQSRLLPAGPPVTTGIEIAGHALHPAQVGGDYYDYIAVRSNLVNFVMADVTGHSFGSALGMAMARTVLRGEIMEGRDPAGVLAGAARTLYADLSANDLMITVFVAQWDGRDGVLRYASAGHNPPYLWRAKTREVEALDADGMIIGVLDESPYESKTTRLEKDDVLLLYTDGIVEAKDPRGQMFGEARLQEALAECVTLPADEILATLFDVAKRFIGDAELHDDISMVVVRATA